MRPLLEHCHYVYVQEARAVFRKRYVFFLTFVFKAAVSDHKHLLKCRLHKTCFGTSVLVRLNGAVDSLWYVFTLLRPSIDYCGILCTGRTQLFNFIQLRSDGL